MSEQKITYPITWDYRIIGEDYDSIERAVFSTTKPLSLKRANESKTGRFVSMHLRVKVDSQKMRDEIFIKIKASPNIKMVL